MGGGREFSGWYLIRLLTTMHKGRTLSFAARWPHSASWYPTKKARTMMLLSFTIAAQTTPSAPASVCRRKKTRIRKRPVLWAFFFSSLSLVLVFRANLAKRLNTLLHFGEQRHNKPLPTRIKPEQTPLSDELFGGAAKTKTTYCTKPERNPMFDVFAFAATFQCSAWLHWVPPVEGFQ